MQTHPWTVEYQTLNKMDLRVTSVAVILMLVLAYGDALRCYTKGVDGKTSVEECIGPCSYVTVDRAVTLQLCDNFGGHDNFCLTSTACFCYTDLCNTGFDASNSQIGAPYPQSGAPNPQGGASGCVALKITWFLAALMVIGARYLH